MEKIEVPHALYMRLLRAANQRFWDVPLPDEYKVYLYAKAVLQEAVENQELGVNDE